MWDDLTRPELGALMTERKRAYDAQLAAWRCERGRASWAAHRDRAEELWHAYAEVRSAWLARPRPSSMTEARA